MSSESAGGASIYDIRRYDLPMEWLLETISFFNTTANEQWLNVYPHTVTLEVSQGVASTIVQPSAPLFPRFLNSTNGLRVLLYNGQFDWLITSRSMDAWLVALQPEWPGAAAYNGTEHQVRASVLSSAIAINMKSNKPLKRGKLGRISMR